MDGLFNSRQQGCEPENGLFVNHSIPLSCTSTETMLQEKTERKEKKKMGLMLTIEYHLHWTENLTSILAL